MDIEKLVKPFLKDIMIYEPGMDKEEHIKLSSNENKSKGKEPNITAKRVIPYNSLRNIFHQKPISIKYVKLKELLITTF